MSFQSSNIWNPVWNYALDAMFLIVAFCGLMVTFSLLANIIKMRKKEQVFKINKKSIAFFTITPIIIVAALGLEIWWRINAFYGVSTIQVYYWWEYLLFSLGNYSFILLVWIIKNIYTNRFPEYKAELIEIRKSTWNLCKRTLSFLSFKWLFLKIARIFTRSKKSKTKFLDIIKSPIEGKAIALNKVKDEAFSKGLLGTGVGIIPTANEGIFRSPIAGTIKTIFHTNHTYGIETKNGTNVLVHIGINTVKLKGKHFQSLQKVGKKIKVGKPIIKANLDKIKAAKYDITTLVVCTPETQGHVSIESESIGKNVDPNSTIIKVN